MNNLVKLMSKWWFRLCIFAGFAVIMFILTMCLALNYDAILGYVNEDGTGYKYLNDGGASMVSVLAVYPAVILMYFACDIINNLRFKVTKLLRTLLLVASLVLYAVILLLVCTIPLADGAEKPVGSAFIDGLAFAPLLTYPLVYFFIVGKFEEMENFQPNRIKEFILILSSLTAPILIGFLLMLIIKLANNATVTFIVYIAFMLIIVVGFIVSFKRYGFYVGGIKEYNREHPSSKSSASSSSSSSSDTSDGTESANTWANRLQDAIKSAAGQFTYIDCYTSVYGDTITLKVKINAFYTSKDDPNYAERHPREFNSAAKDVERVWKETAKNCPYSSELDVEDVS